MAHHDNQARGEKPIQETANAWGNLGFIYNQGYYRGFNFQNLNSAETEAFFKSRNRSICNYTMAEFAYETLGNTTIELTTQYPGLVLGLGYGHGIKALGEFKLGFSFDYTSGLPLIPGSTVKGMLRSVFPRNGLPKKVQFREEKAQYIKNVLQKDTINVDALEKELFEKGKDIFFDAVIHPQHTGEKIVGDDSITPHGDNPLRNPVPLLFLKVLPQITFRFDFEFHDGIISKEEKKNLCTRILLDFGIGAKTNVGYGQLKSVKPGTHES